VITLYDADRCPYCARVRIALAEKGVEYETVEIDLDDRPAWIYEKNPLGRVPVLEEDTFVLPESAVINEYLESAIPSRRCGRLIAAERALGRLLVFRFDQLSKPYYALRREEDGARERLDAELAKLNAVLDAQPYLSGREYGLADIAYVPWIVRARDRMGVDVGRFGALPAGSSSCRNVLPSRPSWTSSPLCEGPAAARVPTRRADVGAAARRASGHDLSARASTAAGRRWTTGRPRSRTRSTASSRRRRVDGRLLRAGAGAGAPERVRGSARRLAADADSPERRAGRADTIELIRRKGRTASGGHGAEAVRRSRERRSVAACTAIPTR
jgi:glutathione S-transferase